MKKPIIYIFFIILQIFFSQSQEKKYSHTNKENNLYIVFTTFRHGARKPMIPYDSFGNFELSIGELTKYGEFQNLEIGKKYRERYSNFVNMNFDENQFLIFTSDWKRVKESVEKQLEGFFNKKIIDNDIFNEVSGGINYFNLYNLNNEEKQELQKYLQYCRKKRKLDVDDDYRKMFTNEIEPILKDCYGKYFTISLHLFCESVFPAYFQYKYDNDKNNKIGKCGKENAEKMYNFCYNWFNTFKEWHEYGAYFFYMFYQNIFNYMNKSINGSTPLKMIMIGGHENTLDKFMNFLDGLKIIERTEYPHFAFNIVIELRKYNNDFYLEFYYNDTLKYNNTLQDFQNVLNNSKYSNLYNYCGVPPWNQNENMKKDSFNNQNENIQTELISNEIIQNEYINNENIKNEKTDETNLIEDNQNRETIQTQKENEENIQNNNKELILNEGINGNRTANSLKAKLKKFFKQDNDLNLYIIICSIIFILIIILLCLFVYIDNLPIFNK